MTQAQMEELGIENEEADKEIWVSWVLEKAIPLEDMEKATGEDPELARILDEKRRAKKSTATSNGPWGKIWDEVHERDGILIRGDKLVVPKSLQAQAIAITHEGHQQTNGTLRMLRQTQWFRNMQANV